MIRFATTELTESERVLQAEVRQFLADELPRGSFAPGQGMNAAKDPAFSSKLGSRGWLGMAVPSRYGGHERSAVDRFIVTEELLRWGAPIGHHWVADRQTAAVLTRYGTESQKQRFLPAICRGELSFSIGMSEPDSGSDLASLTTKATRDGDGWVIQGRKIWTTAADVNDWFVVLCRTTPVDEVTDKRQGLSQLIVDLRSPGITANPITFIDGSADFCEVVLDEVFVPDSLVLGEIGSGWTQNTSELAFERGGADRWLSTYLLVEEYLRGMAEADASDAALAMLGEVTANYWVLHNLSLSVARTIDGGGAPAAEAALVKEMGTRFEQDVVNAVLALVEFEPNLAGDTLFERLLVASTLTAPSFTIRGGTTEILRSVAAKSLQPRHGQAMTEVETPDALLLETVERLLADTCTFDNVERSQQERWSSAIWDPVAAAGLPWVSVPESSGGSGGSVLDAAAILRCAGAFAAPIPVAETGLLAGWLLAEAGLPLPDGPLSVVADSTALGVIGGRLVGRSTVAWATRATRILALVADGQASMIVSIRPDQVAVTPGANMAGEPRDTVDVDLPLGDVEMAPAPAGVDAEALLRRGSLSRILLSAGALETMAQMTVDYASVRRQFGKPIASFQAVQQHLVIVAQSSVRASMAADLAARALHCGSLGIEIAAARVVVDGAIVAATRAAHQAHGAMGVTREYPLHHFSRRLWSWRHEYRNGCYWADVLGRRVQATGADALFPMITNSSPITPSA